MFFGGLFRALDASASKATHRLNPRQVRVEGYSLRIGRRAPLVLAAGARPYGMFVSLTHPELSLAKP